MLINWKKSTNCLNFVEGLLYLLASSANVIVNPMTATKQRTAENNHTMISAANEVRS